MKKTTKMVCAPIATLTLIGSLIGGANAATLSTWSLTSSSTATATLSNGVVVTATASAGKTLSIFESTNADWSGDFGNSFFPTVTIGNALDFNLAQGGAISFSFVGNLDNPEIWYSNAINDLTLSAPFSTISLNEATESGLTLDNTGLTLGGPGDPVQSAGMLNVTGSVASFSIDVANGTGELVRFALVDPVPEPSSTALLGLGCLSLAFRRSRR